MRAVPHGVPHGRIFRFSPVCMKLLLKSLSRYKSKCVLCTALVLLQALCALALPYAMGRLIGVDVQQSGLTDPVPVLADEATLSLLGKVLPEEAYAALAECYAPGQAPARYRAYLDEDAAVLTLLPEKEETAQTLYRDAVLSALILVRGHAQGMEFELNELLQTDLTFFSGMLQEIEIPAEDRAASYAQARSAEPNLKYQAGLLLLPFVYKNSGMDTDAFQARSMLKTALLMLCSIALQAVCGVFAGRISSSLACDVEADLRERLLSATARLRRGDLRELPPRRLLQAALSDAAQVGMVLNTVLRTLPFAVFVAGLGMAVSLRKSVVFGLLIPGCALVAGALIAVLYFTTSGRYYRLEGAYYRYEGLWRERLRQFITVKILGTAGTEETELSGVSEEIRRDESFVLRAVSLGMGCLNLVTGGITLLIVFAGGKNILNMPVGIADIITYVQFALLALAALLTLAVMLLFSPAALRGAENIRAVLEHPAAAEGEGLAPAEGISAVEVRGLRAGGQAEEISFTAARGEIVGITGRTGCGKTTLLQCIAGFAVPDAGEILLNGVPARQYAADFLEERVAFAPDRPTLLSAPLRENLLLYGARDDVPAMLEGLQAARCDFIPFTPEALRQPVENGGENLSGGQRSRIALAGVLAKPADVYLFDDCFTALDAETVEMIMKRIMRLSQNAAVIIATGRAELLQCVHKTVSFAPAATDTK